MKYISIVLSFALALTFASCQRDDVDDLGEGIAAGRIKLNFQIESHDIIELDTRATEAVESDLQQLFVFVFDKDGKPLKMEEIDDLNMTDKSEYSRSYTGSIKNDQSNQIKSGDKVYLYAVGNPNTRLSNGMAGWIEAYEKGRDAFASRIFRADKLTLEPLGTSVPFTGRASDDASVTVGKDGEIKTFIRLRRPYAKVDFSFHVGKDNITFQPTGYDLCNLPHGCAQHYTGQVLDEATAATIEYETISNNQFSLANPMFFSFYMLENLQKAKNDVKTYHDRDKKNVDENGAHTGGFVNAPDNGTYVVVHGKYTEYKTAEKNDIKYVGDVSYTIHLGDFSKNNFSNFSVERNHWYTYDVTVNGVDQIIVEAKDKTETQSGAEGYILDATESAMIFDLDSHYETVLLRIPLAAIDPVENKIAIRKESGLTLRVASPYTEYKKEGGNSPGVSNIISYEDLFNATLADFEDGDKVGGTFTFERTLKLLRDNKALDVDWIRYVSQDQGETAMPYYESIAANKNSMNSFDLILVLGRILTKIQADYNTNGISAFDWSGNDKANVKVYEIGGLPPMNSAGPSDPATNPGYRIPVVRSNNRLYLYLTAYVDEFVYDYNPYSMIEHDTDKAYWPEFTNVAPRAMYVASSPTTSNDGASTYATILFTISQKSIGTPFRTDDPTINAYGFESVDETRPTSSFDYLQNSHGDRLDGLNNYRTLLKERGGVKLGESRWADFVNFSVTSNTYRGQREDKINNMMLENQAFASYLCLQRNRDLDGDGIIDEEEIEWYLPAINQYVSMWIGTEGVLTSARLYDGSTTAAAADINAYNQLNHMYTSSADNQRVYWAIEGASYGRYQREWMAASHGVRCARNLQFTTEKSPSYSSVLEEESDGKGGKRTIYNLANLSSSAVRSTASFLRGEYGPHNERQIQNKPAQRFQLAKNDLELPAREEVAVPSLKAPNVVKGVELVEHTIPASPRVKAELTKREVVNTDTEVAQLATEYTLSMTILDPQEGWTYGYTNLATLPDAEINPWTLFSSDEHKASLATLRRDAHTYYVWGRDAAGNYADYTRVTIRPDDFDQGKGGIVVEMREANTHDDIYLRMSAYLHLIDMSQYDNDGSDLHTRLGENTAITYEVSIGGLDSWQQVRFNLQSDGHLRSIAPLREPESPIRIRARYVFVKPYDSSSSSYVSNPVIINLVNGEWVYDTASGQPTEDKKVQTGGQSYFSSDYVATSNNLCAKYYSEEADKSDLGLWRVPNQREFAVIMLRGTGSTSMSNASYMSRTTFSNTHVGRTLFYFNAGTGQIELVTSQNNVSDAKQVAPVSGRIRCVRDREPKEIERVTSPVDGSYNDGGQLTN